MLVRVRDGKHLAHHGDVLNGGAELELPDAIALECAHLVDEVLPTGETRGVGATAPADLKDVLARHRPHERVSILEEARAKTAGDLDAIEQQLTVERKRAADEQKAIEAAEKKRLAATAKPEPPKGEK